MNAKIEYINSKVLSEGKHLKYTVKRQAPSTESELFSSTSLIIWDGESNNTVFQDPLVNYSFRAIHDSIHLKTGLGFSIDHEIEMGRIQANILASRCDSLLADLFYCEIAEQAKYFKLNGTFVKNQIEFTKNYINLGE